MVCWITFERLLVLLEGFYGQNILLGTRQIVSINFKL